jgi:predicted MPP superfamily phosphohydrolase
MRVLTIPDLHGKTVWKDAVVDPQFSEAEKIVFIGDYVDSYDLSDKFIYANFLEIIEFRKQNPDKVVLLLGNHDIQYLFYPNYRCSGFRAGMQHQLSDLFQENISLFKVAFQLKNHLWTHAGVSNGWLEENRAMLLDYGLKDMNYAEAFNEMLVSPDRDILHQVGELRGGSHEYGGITWADLQETITNPISGAHQFVGHTPVHVPFRKDFPELSSSITYLDCLRSMQKFIIVSV